MDGLLSGSQQSSIIKTVDMHTCGESTRIIINGYPELEGQTLLDKRANARDKHDKIRQRLMREPRGHADMYGAILVRETELTLRGEADIGVLFCHNEGYSTMCGHATIALGRFLVDTHDLQVFPRREELVYNSETCTTHLRLHAPCGVVQVTVPTRMGDGAAKSNPSEPISFLSVPSFVSAQDVYVDIPKEKRWERLRAGARNRVKVDVAYGGAFYAMVSAEALGFQRGLRGGYKIEEFNEATATLKHCMQSKVELFRHPSEADLGYLYGVMVVDREIGMERGEAGLCFFADQQVDRSPTGSCVSARVALGVEKGQLDIGQSWEYHSIVSLKHRESAFKGRAISRVAEGYIVECAGISFYTGTSTFVSELKDSMADGFVFEL